jgi:hypothetical protein
MGNSPTWRLGDEAQPRLPVEPIDLVNDAINVERQV